MFGKSRIEKTRSEFELEGTTEQRNYRTTILINIHKIRQPIKIIE